MMLYIREKIDKRREELLRLVQIGEQKAVSTYIKYNLKDGPNALERRIRREILQDAMLLALQQNQGGGMFRVIYERAHELYVACNYSHLLVAFQRDDFSIFEDIFSGGVQYVNDTPQADMEETFEVFERNIYNNRLQILTKCIESSYYWARLCCVIWNSGRDIRADRKFIKKKTGLVLPAYLEFWMLEQ